MINLRECEAIAPGEISVIFKGYTIYQDEEAVIRYIYLKLLEKWPALAVLKQVIVAGDNEFDMLDYQIQLELKHDQGSLNPLGIEALAKTATWESNGQPYAVILLRGREMSQLLIGYKDAVNILAHELGHVHGLNMQWQIFKDTEFNYGEDFRLVKLELSQSLIGEFWADYIACDYTGRECFGRDHFLIFLLKEITEKVKSDLINEAQDNYLTDDLFRNTNAHIRELLRGFGNVLGTAYGLECNGNNEYSESLFQMIESTSAQWGKWVREVYMLFKQLVAEPLSKEHLSRLCDLIGEVYNNLGIMLIYDKKNKSHSAKVITAEKTV